MNCRPRNLYKEMQIRLDEINIAKRISFLISCTKFSITNLRRVFKLNIYGAFAVIISGQLFAITTKRDESNCNKYQPSWQLKISRVPFQLLPI